MLQGLDLDVADVVVPARWALYQDQHFARVLENGTHILQDREPLELMGDDCGYGPGLGSNEPCQLGINSWNYTFMYPLVSYGADPNAEDPTIESG